MTVALVVTVVPPPEDVAVADEDELDVEEDCEDETDELEDEEDELPSEDEACLIAFNTPCRQWIEANCPEENPEIETRGSTRHAR